MLNKKKRAIVLQIKAAHKLSIHCDMPLDIFSAEVHKLAAGRLSAIDFDDLFYLDANPDVKLAVQSGDYLCGYIHYCLHGHDERRLWSNNHIRRKFSVQPQLGKDIFKPINSYAPFTYGPDLSSLPHADKPTLLLLLPNLQPELFYAGYSAFFNDLKAVFPIFYSITVVVVSKEFDPVLVQSYDDRIEVIHLSQIDALAKNPSVIIHFDCETYYIARDIFGAPERTIYYCQDFEAGFYPLGSNFARCEHVLAHTTNMVVSTRLLLDFLEHRYPLLRANIYVTSPVFNTVTVEPFKTRRLFFYFRPEHFNSRNMPELVMAAVDAFCRKHKEYEIFLCGTVKTSYSFNLYGTNVTVLSKLPKLTYEALLSSCDVVVALIYSAHPGVIAFQAAASGIPTVTNTFDIRDATVLHSISENIVTYDPVCDELLDKIEIALQMPKGRPSFNADFYDAGSRESFIQYISGVMHVSSYSHES